MDTSGRSVDVVSPTSISLPGLSMLLQNLLLFSGWLDIGLKSILINFFHSSSRDASGNLSPITQSSNAVNAFPYSETTNLIPTEHFKDFQWLNCVVYVYFTFITRVKDKPLAIRSYGKLSEIGLHRWCAGILLFLHTIPASSIHCIPITTHAKCDSIIDPHHKHLLGRKFEDAEQYVSFLSFICIQASHLVK
jgi:hypothetical protein